MFQLFDIRLDNKSLNLRFLFREKPRGMCDYVHVRGIRQTQTKIEFLVDILDSTNVI